MADDIKIVDRRRVRPTEDTQSTILSLLSDRYKKEAPAIADQVVRELLPVIEGHIKDGKLGDESLLQKALMGYHQQRLAKQGWRLPQRTIEQFANADLSLVKSAIAENAAAMKQAANVETAAITQSSTAAAQEEKLMQRVWKNLTDWKRSEAIRTGKATASVARAAKQAIGRERDWNPKVSNLGKKEFWQQQWQKTSTPAKVIAAPVVGAGYLGYRAGKSLSRVVQGGVSSGTVSILFFLAILLAILDVFTNYKGIEFEFFKDSFLPLLTKWLLYSGFTIYLALTFFLKIAGRPQDMTILQAIKLSLSLIIWRAVLIVAVFGSTFGTKNIGLFFHLVFSMMLYFLLIKKIYGDTVMADIVYLILWMFDTYGASLAYTLGSSLGKDFLVEISDRWLLPLYILYIGFNNKIERPRWVVVGSVIMATFMTISMIPSQAYAQIFGGEYAVGGKTKLEIYKDTGNDFLKNTLSRLYDPQRNDTVASKFSIWVDRTFGGGYIYGGIESQDYSYEAQTDKKAKEKLGVYIEDIELSETDIWEKMPFMLWGVVKSQTLDEPINVRINCSTGEINANIEEELANFTVVTYSENDLQCKFNGLPAGSHTINITATFNMETNAYLKTYFIDQEKLNTLKSQNIDVFSEYKITDKNPVAIYTNGPVKVAIGSKTPPIGLVRAGSNSYPKLGVTIQNQWEGMLLEVNKLEIYVPYSIRLDYCDWEVTEEPILYPDPISDQKYHIYSLEENALKKLENLDKFKTFNCRMVISEDTANEVLGNTPFVTKYFRVKTSYKYKTMKQFNINVKKSSGVYEGEYMGGTSRSIPLRGCGLIKDEAKCKGEELCIAKYEQDKFIECQECPYVTRNCAIYEDKEQCDKDGCLQFCYWKQTDPNNPSIGSCLQKSIQDIRKEVIWPTAIENNKIGSCFGYRTIQDKQRFHYGIDIYPGTNKNIYAILDGIIVSEDFNEKPSYHLVKIQHYPGFRTIYMHLSKKEEGIELGKKVKKDDKIGEIGGYGPNGDRTWKEHLHFELEINGNKMNPIRHGNYPATLDWIYDPYKVNFKGVSEQKEIYFETKISSETGSTTGDCCSIKPKDYKPLRDDMSVYNRDDMPDRDLCK